MTMKKRFLPLVVSLLGSLPLFAQVTLEECVTLARENYPLIRKYDLLAQVEEIDLSEINKSWLPQVSLYGQGTAQNETPSFPESLAKIVSQTGTFIMGVDEWQYKAGVDIRQNVWDGGESKAQRNTARAERAERQAALDVQLYAVMVEAQCLSVKQQLIQAERSSKSYREVLGLFTGKQLAGQELLKPDASIPHDLVPNRPELRHFEAQAQVNEAKRASVAASTMPRIGLFAQAYYGYPGFDYFESMMGRDPSVNLLAGVKVSWNLGAFYHKKNENRKLRLASDNIAVERDVFLFNTNLKIRSQLDRIDELRAVMQENKRIVELRERVRKAAESQLDNGIIDATDLLAKLTEEKQARLTASYHEIQLLQGIYRLKYTLNR